MNNISFFDAIFLGKLTRDTIVNSNKDLFIDKPGGNLLYSAYGFALWGKTPGLVSRVGCDFPDEWIEDLGSNLLNTKGISRNLENTDSRIFIQVDKDSRILEGNPRKYFSEQNLPLPKVLLGLEAKPVIADNRRIGSEYSIRPEDIPANFLDSRYLALCPIDFFTHNIIPAFFRAQTSGEVFIHASNSYTHSSFFYDIPALVNGVSILMISEENVKRLFLGKMDDTWMIAETVAGFGVEIIVISKKTGGYDVFDNNSKKRFHVPSYSVNCIDPIGADDVFFGGFLASYLSNFDPQQATLIGSVTASIKKEGSTPAFLLGTLKELLLARVDVLREKVESI